MRDDSVIEVRNSPWFDVDRREYLDDGSTTRARAGCQRTDGGPDEREDGGGGQCEGQYEQKLA